MRVVSVAAAVALVWACSPPAETPTTADDTQTPPTSAEMSVAMARATNDGLGEAVGTVLIRDGAQGAAFELNLYGLPPGEHGLHVHQTPDCGPAMENGEMTPAAAAAGHWDPENTGRHAGPEGDGHLGDLPRIQAGDDGRVVNTVTAPRIDDIERLRGHALMIHEGGDNYSDTPEELGGGGARIACGLIG